MIEKAGQAALNAKMRNSAAQSANLAGSIGCSVTTFLEDWGYIHGISYFSKWKKKTSDQFV